jgi:hypothetical protein
VTHSEGESEQNEIKLSGLMQARAQALAQIKVMHMIATINSVLIN